MTLIRDATPDDLPAIEAIYNHYVRTSTATYQLTPDPFETREAWFAAHAGRYPVLVALEVSEVVGWASLSPFHPRAAYAGTVEDSIYVRHDCHRRGIGAALLAALLDRGREAAFHTVVALIDSGQAPSIALHTRFGFVETGRLAEAGRKFDRWLDVIYMQLLL
ncbi:MAG: N-acetyltransferase family protein [Dehalococcoidia bacterium]